MADRVDPVVELVTVLKREVVEHQIKVFQEEVPPETHMADVRVEEVEGKREQV
jgi:hypothetical protein